MRSAVSQNGAWHPQNQQAKAKEDKSMIANACHFGKVNIRAATVLAGLLVTACVPPYAEPQQVQASNPTVTYKYRGDQELLQADQSAATFCSRYQSVPRTASFGSDVDGRKVVVYECVQSATLASAPPPTSNLAYNYQTDQQLLDASRHAQIYCMNNGSQEVVSNIANNADGTRTVTFQCAPR
jgi:hypothetical protein